MKTRNKSNTGIILAGIGGGAALLWLLWRGRGKGKREDRGTPPTTVTVWILSGDRLALDRADGASIDLATMMDLAHAAGLARVHATGDARQGWIEKVKDALLTAGVQVDSFL